MLQRIQSIFLAVIVVVMILTLFFPLWEKNNPNLNEKAVLTAWNLTHTGDHIKETSAAYYTGMCAVLAALFAGYSIFKYNNRKQQMMLGAINSLFIAGMLGSMMYFGTRQGEVLFSPSIKGSFTFAYYLDWIALFCNILANRFIRRDEQLVRSADRIR